MIIAGVLAFCGLIAMQASSRLSQFILAIFLGLASVLVLLRWPNAGLLGVIAGSIFIGYQGPGGINVTVLSSAGLIGLWIFDMMIRKRKVVFFHKPTTLTVMAFLLSAGLSFGIGQLPWYPVAHHAPVTAQIGGLLIFVVSILTYLYAANTIRDLRWLQVICWFFIALGTIYILARILGGPFGRIVYFYQSGIVASGIAWMWLGLIPFSQALINRRLNIVLRAGLFALTAGVLYISIIQTSDWKSGYLPALAGMAVVVALMLRMKVVWLTPFVLFVAISLGSELIASDEYSYITRIDAWKVVIELAMISPVFGLGFSNYYWYTHLMPILGWRVAFNSHSQFVDLFAQTGLVGIAAFFWVFLEAWRLGWSLRDRVPEGFAKAYVYGVMGGIVGTMVAAFLGDWVLPFVYNVGMTGVRSSILIWIFLGGMVAIERIVTSDKINKREIEI